MHLENVLNTVFGESGWHLKKNYENKRTEKAGHYLSRDEKKTRQTVNAKKKLNLNVYSGSQRLQKA